MATHENAERFRVLPKWKKAMEGFFHGQRGTVWQSGKGSDVVAVGECDCEVVIAAGEERR